MGSTRLRAVLAANVLLAALRSREGASFEIFRQLRLGKWTAILINHLLYESEEILKREAPTLHFPLGDVDEVLNAIAVRCGEWILPYGWGPGLSDPDDETLVQLAHESGSMRIVTHNIRDLHPPAREALAGFPIGQEQEKGHDSFLFGFTKPPDAVRFALHLQRRMRLVVADNSTPVLDSIGIHVGDVRAGRWDAEDQERLWHAG